MKSPFGWFSVCLFACLAIAAPTRALVDDRPDPRSANAPAHLEMEICLQEEDLVIQGEDRIGNLTIKIRADGIELPRAETGAETSQPRSEKRSGIDGPSIQWSPPADLVPRLARKAIDWAFRMFIQFLTA